AALDGGCALVAVAGARLGDAALAHRARSAATIDAALAGRAVARAWREHGERADVAAAKLLPGQVEGRVAGVCARGRRDVDRAHPDRLATDVAWALCAEAAVSTT